MDIYHLINSSSAKLHVVVLSAFKVVKRDKRMKNDKLLTNMIEELHQYSETQYSETQYSETQYSETQYSETQYSETQYSETQYSKTQYSETH